MGPQRSRDTGKVHRNPLLRCEEPIATATVLQLARMIQLLLARQHALLGWAACMRRFYSQDMGDEPNGAKQLAALNETAASEL